jgi:hypothetical protein
MAYIPGCRADVFISYAHLDNVDGWITRLKSALTEKLNAYLAGRAEVWFDDRIRPGTYFKDEIQHKLKDTPIFVAIVSPSYLESSFSIVDELEWFQNRGGGDIIQLLKVPLQHDQYVPLPDAQYRLLYSDSNGRLLEGDALNAVLDDVVAAIISRLRQSWEIRPKIYFSQIRNEAWRTQWELLKERLHGGGYAILPKGVLPVRVPDDRIRVWLKEARLSIHPRNPTDDPLAQRQLDLARQLGGPVVEVSAPPSDAEMQAIVADVQRQLETDRNPGVYLIYDQYSDREWLADLPELIRQKTGCEVYLPVAGETYHKFRLNVSEGVLLFRGNAPDEWLKAQEQSLLQAAARRHQSRIIEAKYFLHKPNGHPVGVQRSQGARLEWIIERIGEPNIDDLGVFFDALPPRLHSAGGLG